MRGALGCCTVQHWGTVRGLHNLPVAPASKDAAADGQDHGGIDAANDSLRLVLWRDWYLLWGIVGLQRPQPQPTWQNTGKAAPRCPRKPWVTAGALVGGCSGAAPGCREISAALIPTRHTTSFFSGGSVHAGGQVKTPGHMQQQWFQPFTIIPPAPGEHFPLVGDSQDM